LQIINIINQGQNLLLISGILVSYLISYYGIRVLKIERDIMDLFSNAFITIVLIWKFSYTILHFNSVLQNPMTILYFNGGYTGIVIGGIFTLFRTLLYIKKHNISLDTFMRAAVPVYLGYFNWLVWFKVYQNPYEYPMMIQGIIAILFFLAVSRFINKGALLQLLILQLLIWFHVIQFELSLYKNRFLYTDTISKELLIYSLLTITFVCILRWLGRNERQNTHKSNEKKPKDRTSQAALFIIICSLAITSILTSLQKPGETVHSVPNIQREVGINQGQIAPDFELLSVTGDTLKLSDLRGKTVILNFWASWCPPCKAEIPEMKKFYQKNKSNQIEIVGVNLTNTESSPDVVKNFVNNNGIMFKVLFDENGDVGDRYRAITIPTSYIIDKNGIIRDKYIGPMSYETMNNFISLIGKN